MWQTGEDTEPATILFWLLEAYNSIINALHLALHRPILDDEHFLHLLVLEQRATRESLASKRWRFSADAQFLEAMLTPKLHSTIQLQFDEIMAVQARRSWLYQQQINERWHDLYTEAFQHGSAFLEWQYRCSQYAEVRSTHHARSY